MYYDNSRQLIMHWKIIDFLIETGSEYFKKSVTTTLHDAKMISEKKNDPHDEP